MTAPVVEVRSLVCSFPAGGRWLRRERIEAVRSVDLALQSGELVALVGESGSGKTTLARTIAGLLKPTSGAIFYRGIELDRGNHSLQREFRRRRSIVFQNPYQSLNPRMRIESALREALKVAGMPRADVSPEIDRLLLSVGLPLDYRVKHPLALSGGERQRVAIARALAARPDLLIADEVTSALDVSVSAQIVNLLLDLQSTANFACLLITHDLSLALAVADRVVIMRGGSIVDQGTPRDVAKSTQGYTRTLIELGAPPSFEAAPVRR